MPKFNYIRISELSRQLRLSPTEVRRREIDRCEQLLAKIDPAKEYPYQFVYHWITNTQPPRHASRPHMLAGKELLADVSALILQLSDSLNTPRADFPPDTMSLEDLAREHNVACKTISRWRKRGLAARKAIFPDGRRRLVFLPSSLRQFQNRNKQLLANGSRFQRLSKDQKKEIIDRARSLYRQAEMTPYQVCLQLAHQEKRAIETIRSLLRLHDQLHPEDPVFPPANARLTDQQKEDLFKAFSQHLPLDQLSRSFRRSRSSIYRMINEIRSKRIKNQAFLYIYNPQFDLPGFDRQITPVPTSPKAPRTIPSLQPQQPLPEYLRQLCTEPLLSPQQELHLFRQLNYAKFQADLLRRRLGPYQNPTALIGKIEALLTQANDLKNRIVASNLRLVVSIAKRHIGPRARIFELISDGNISLMKAVERFDYSRRYRFSTYASWIISRDYAKTVPQINHQLEHYITGQPTMLDVATDGRGDGELLKPEILAQKDLIDEILQVLDPRQRHIVAAHFGLGERQKPQSLEAIGISLGLSKQRIRQIESQALSKLRKLLSLQEPTQD